MRPATRLRLGEVTLQECGGHRQNSRSVSWNGTGQWLASASSDRLAKIFTIEGREITALTGHSASLDRVRFHPTEPTLLCTTAQDRSVRVWDVRSAGTSRNVSKIDLVSSSRFGVCPASVEWHPGNGGRAGGNGGRYLAVAEKDNAVRIYDMRKLTSTGVKSTNNGGKNRSPAPVAASATPVKTFELGPTRVLQECHFSPSGTHLVAGTRSGTDGMGEIRVWQWDAANDSCDANETGERHHVFPGHTGPIYTHHFSPDGTRLATGGNDAIVGLWDVESMVCTHTITRRSKFIRSVAFSYDSRLVACSSEEDGIDIADASTGENVGVVTLALPSSSHGHHHMHNAPQGGGGGADEIAFHPKAYLLACARAEPVIGGGGRILPPQLPVTIAKLSLATA